MSTTWGVHGLGPRRDFIAERLIALDRPGIGSLAAIGNDRARLKMTLSTSYPAEKPGTIAAWAGVLLRFAFEANEGELVIHPNKFNRTLAFGRLVDGYFFDEAGLHCRHVRWLVAGVPRDAFSDEAQKAVSGRHAFFAVPRAVEFDRWLAEGNLT